MPNTATYSGGGWYDPQHQRLLAPSSNSPASNPYDAHVTLLGSEWLGSHASGIAIGATVIAGVAATVLTAGALGGFAAAGIEGVVAGATFTGADLAVAGAAGGIVGSVGSSYAAGNSLGRVALDGAIGGVAGAVGGLVGAAFPGAAQLCPAALESWVIGGVAGGAVGGAIQGGYEGYQTNGLNGIAGGALEGAITGGAIGGAGALLGYAYSAGWACSMAWHVSCLERRYRLRSNCAMKPGAAPMHRE
jgi:hypothetical protein